MPRPVYDLTPVSNILTLPEHEAEVNRVLTEFETWIREILRQLALYPVTNPAGTGDAIEGELEFPPIANMTVVMVPPGTNSTNAPTLSVNGGAAREIRKGDGTRPAPGDIVNGQGIILRYVAASSTWRIVGTPSVQSDIAAMVEATVAPLRGRVAAVWSSVWNATVFPPDVTTVLQRQDNNWGLWLERPTPPQPLTSDWQQTTDGRWWKRVVGSLEISDLQAGRLQSQWSKTFGTTTFKPGVNTVLQRTETTWGIWLPVDPPTVVESYHQQDATGKWWRRVIGDEEFAAIQNRTSDAGAIRLAAIGGTPDTITAQMPPSMVGVKPKAGDWFWFTPTASNAGSSPTLTIDIDDPRIIRDEKSVPLKPGALVAGVPHLMRVFSWQFIEVMGTMLSLADAAAVKQMALGQTPGVAKSGTVSMVQQTTAALPTRPTADMVIWRTWDNPAPRMTWADEWHVIDPPTIPAAPLPEEWDLLNARTGDSLIVRLTNIPVPIPPLIAVEYQVNSGSWVRVNDVKRGDDIVIPGLASGVSITVAIRYRNYLGAGPASSTKSMAPSTADFSDSFTRADARLSTDPRWEDFQLGVTGTRGLVIRSNHVEAEANNEDVGSYIREYFPPDQFARYQLISPGISAGLPRGIFLWMRADFRNPLAMTGYQLRVSAMSWYLERFRNGTAFRLANGTIAAGQVPGVVQLRIVGDVLTASIAGTTVATVTDASPEKITGGGIGLTMHNAASDGTGALKIDDFVAGKAL